MITGVTLGIIGTALVMMVLVIARLREPEDQGHPADPDRGGEERLADAG